MADTPTYEYDVFLSHNRADKDWTRALATRIEREEWNGRPLKVFFDEWDIQPGDNIPIALEKALPKSRKIALVMSPDFFKSEWTESERAAVTIFSPANRAKRLIPLYVRTCEALPALVAPLNYIDFRDPLQYEAKLRQLLAFLRDEPLPRGDGGGDQKGDHKGSPLRNLEIPRPPLVGFVARRDKDGHNLVEYVSELLAKDNAFIALWGAGGIGKTALAAEIARHHLPSPLRRGAGGEVSAVVWATADGRVDFSLGTLLDVAATQMGQSDLRTLALDAKTEAVRNLLAGLGDHVGTGDVGDHKGSPLLVMDNFETVAEAEQTRIAEFLANAPCAALVTSRQITPRARNIEIDAMGASEAREFVDKLIEVSPRREVFKGLDAKQIITTAQANPLVMEWVVAQIAEAAQEPHRVFDELAHGKGDAAQRVFDRSFNLLYLGDDGRAALLALTLFVPNATRETLAEVAGLDAERVDDAISRLVSLRLAETTQGNARIGVRGLTRELAKIHCEQDKRSTDWARRFVEHFLRYAEAHAKTTPEDLDALEAERENLLAAMDASFAAQDWQSVMRIADRITSSGQLLAVRGYWDDAIARGEQAAEAARFAGDEDATGRFSGNVATTHRSRGEYEKAQEIYVRILEDRRHSGNEAGVAVYLHRLGMIAQQQGDYETARSRYAESFEIFKKLGDQSGIARTLHNLGAIAQDQGDYKTAQARYAESFEIFKKLGDQSGIALTLGQLGNLSTAQGDYSQAEEYYHDALEIFRKLGDQSEIASTLHQLGMLAEINGDKTEAARLFSESLDIFERLKSAHAEIARKSLKRVLKDGRTQ